LVKRDKSRSIISVSGEGAWGFLQGLITNDLAKELNKLSYAALLSPQGKFLFDFFIFAPVDNVFLVDVDSSITADFLTRLSMYKLRMKLDIAETDFFVVMSKNYFDNEHSFPDPRNKKLGFRNYSLGAKFSEFEESKKLGWVKNEYEMIRIKNCIPDFGKELISNETYILEAGFERIAGVSFTKGCFIGQEVTARMKHKTTLRKGLVTVYFDKEKLSKKLEYGASIFSDGREIGQVLSFLDNYAIAYVKFDKIKNDMSCNGGILKILD
tara:strand:+ start:2173 stop:2976 length:804 start_codon:yes stop_codon:yes gene_type:complete